MNFEEKGMNSDEKRGVIILYKFKEPLKKLPAEEQGKILMAAIEYDESGTEPEFDNLATDVLFEMMKLDFDRMKKSWEDQKQINHKRAVAGANKRWNKQANENTNNNIEDDNSIDNSVDYAYRILRYAKENNINIDDILNDNSTSNTNENANSIKENANNATSISSNAKNALYGYDSDYGSENDYDYGDDSESESENDARAREEIGVADIEFDKSNSDHTHSNNPQSGTEKTEQKADNTAKKSKKSKSARKAEWLTREECLYFLDNNETYEFSNALENSVKQWIGYKCERIENYVPTGLKSMLTEVDNNRKKYGEPAVIELIDYCMAKGWKGIIWERLDNTSNSVQNANNNEKTKKSSNPFD